MIRLRWLFIALLFIGGWVAASPHHVQASCVVETTGSYSEGDSIRDDKCDVNGNKKFTNGTLAAGEDLPNDLMKVAPQARTAGGATAKRYISVGTTEDEHAVCTAPCTVYSILVTNTNAAARHFKCFGDTAANTTPGTSVPVIDVAIPGATTGAGFSIPMPVGVSFATALTCWIVTGAAESDATEVASNELKVFYTYKQ